jgi:hypothetical protein
MPPLPATLQLCVNHRYLSFHLTQADVVLEALRQFLANPRDNTDFILCFRLAFFSPTLPLLRASHGCWCGRDYGLNGC